MKGCGVLVMRKIHWGDLGKAPCKRCCLGWGGRIRPLKRNRVRKCPLDREIYSHLVHSQGDYKIPNIHGEPSEWFSVPRVFSLNLL